MIFILFSSVEPQVAVNVEQDYTSTVGEDVVLECGLQFGSLRETPVHRVEDQGGYGPCVI